MTSERRANQPNGSNARRSAGFTLIEVLVAMSIVVVSFVALYGVVLQMVGAVTVMQEKTLASWIAFDRITEIRVRGDFPDESEEEDTVEMAGITWLYKREVNSTDSEDIRQIIVRVAPEDEPDNTLAIATGVVVRNQRTSQLQRRLTPPGGGGQGPDGFDQGNGTEELTE